MDSLIIALYIVSWFVFTISVFQAYKGKRLTVPVYARILALIGVVSSIVGIFV